MTSPAAIVPTKRERAIEFCEMTREQRARTDRSTRHVVQAALAAGLTPTEIARHTGLTIEQVTACQEGDYDIGARQG